MPTRNGSALGMLGLSNARPNGFAFVVDDVGLGNAPALPTRYKTRYLGRRLEHFYPKTIMDNHFL
jgi:hypothetical protein